MAVRVASMPPSVGLIHGRTAAHPALEGPVLKLDGK